MNGGMIDFQDNHLLAMQQPQQQTFMPSNAYVSAFPYVQQSMFPNNGQGMPTQAISSVANMQPYTTQNSYVSTSYPVPQAAPAALAPNTNMPMMHTMMPQYISMPYTPGMDLNTSMRTPFAVMNASMPVAAPVAAPAAAPVAAPAAVPTDQHNDREYISNLVNERIAERVDEQVKKVLAKTENNITYSVKHDTAKNTPNVSMSLAHRMNSVKYHDYTKKGKR
jgi:hypothetical protein